MFDFSLKATVDKYPNNPALISETKTITYSEVSAIVGGIALELRKLKLKEGDRVAVLSENSLEYVILIWALLSEGIVFSPLSTRNPQGLINKQIELINCSYLFVSEAYNKNFIAGLRAIEIEPLIDNQVNIKENYYVNKIDLERDATIIFTSGSAAVPKAVLHSIGNHYFSALGSNENILLESNSRWLLSLPLYHVGGLAILVRCVLNGAAVIIPEKHKLMIEQIGSFQVTHLSLVAAQLYRLFNEPDLKEKIKNVEAILMGGGFIPDKLVRDAVSLGLPLYKSYGMTEMASQVTTTQKLEEAVSHSGKALKYRQIKIDANGEILLKGETLFKGYLRGDELESPVDADGWFHAGDKGFLDNDNCLQVIGRTDNMFISGGENIHPEEIERTILNCFDFENVIVVAVDDAEFGKVPAVFLDGEFDEQNIKNKLKECLPSYKIPKYLFSWPRDYRQSNFKPSRSDFYEIAKNKLI